MIALVENKSTLRLTRRQPRQISEEELARRTELVERDQFWNRVYRDTEAWYRKKMLPQVRKQIEEFKAEIGEWGLKRRLEYLLTAQRALAIRIIELGVAYEVSHELHESYVNRAILLPYIDACKKSLRKVKSSIKHINNLLAGKDCQDTGITDVMIERAKEYPIDQLVEVGSNGMAHCIAHDDKNPSMSCKKNNRVHCFACGFKGDSIGVYRQLHGVGFVDAVEALQ